MRRACAVFLTIILSFVFCLPVLAEDADSLSLYAKSAVLMDADSGRILYDKNGSEQLPMASTTKIMTCILALEYADTESTLNVSARAAAMPKVHLGMREGEQYRLLDVLYSMMLESHNDSAAAVAEHVSGSIEAFASLMNQKARDIGCYDTFFITPNGLDATAENADGETIAHHTTARDLARILRYCIMESPKREEFLSITQTSSYSFSDVDGTRQFSCTNHNAFLTMMDGALTGKTGFTANAGYCYVGALTRDERTFIVALLACGWPDNKSYKWADTRALMNYGIENYAYREPDETLNLPVLAVENGVDETDPFAASCTVATALSETTDDAKTPRFLMRADERAELRVQVPESVQAPVAKGQVVGSVQYVLGGEIMAEYVLTAANTVQKRDFFWCIRQISLQFTAGEGTLQ